MQPIIYIYQLKDIKETKYLHDKCLEELNAFGKSVDFENYIQVWKKPLDPEDTDAIAEGKIKEVLEYYYNLLNEDKPPKGFTGLSPLSVADVIGLYIEGEMKAFYVDKEGFDEIEGFFPENFAKDAEASFDYSNDFNNLPGFADMPDAQIPQPPRVMQERHFYTSLYLDLGDGSEMTEEEADEKMRLILESIKDKHPEFAFTIHDIETNDYLS